MQLRVSLSMLLPLFFVGCEDDRRLLSIEDLCPQLALDICEVRIDGCCPEVRDLAACRGAEEERCRAELAPYAAESGSLSYDSIRASRERDLARTELDGCGPLPSLARFFDNGLPLGTACERGAQCVTGACTGEPLTCTPPPPAPLCGAPVPATPL